MNKTVKKVFNIIVDILIIIVFIISAFIAVLSISSGSTGVPNLFGYAPLTVLSNSMEPTFEKDDMIIAKVSDENTEYKVGDIVTFKVSIDGYDRFNSHTIVEVQKSESGSNLYVTKGDNNELVDQELQNDASIVAVYTGTCLKGWGGPYAFLKSQTGFFIIIVIPMILFFVYQAIRVVQNIIAYNKEKALAEANKVFSEKIVGDSDVELTEEQMKQAVQQYLAKEKEAAVETADAGTSGEKKPAPAETDAEESDTGENSKS